MYSSNAFSNPHLSHNIVNDKNGSISRHMTFLSKQWWLFRELANIDFRSNQMRLRNFDDDYNINGHVNKVNRKTSSMKHQRHITVIRMRAMCVLFPSFVITTAVCKWILEAGDDSMKMTLWPDFQSKPWISCASGSCDFSRRSQILRARSIINTVSVFISLQNMINLIQE